VVLDGAPRATLLGRSRYQREREPPEACFSYSPELNPVERGGFMSSGVLSPIGSSRPSSYFKERSPMRLSPIGRTLLAYDALLVSRGGWKQSSHWDINALDRYKVLCHNICVLGQARHELGIEPNFGAEFPVAPQLPVIRRILVQGPLE
jgi:hypothetical protein